MSFLQECVKQVKPRTENYTPPVEKIQNILSEAFGLADIWKRDNHKNFIDKLVAGELLNADGITKFPKLSAGDELVKLLKSLKDEPETKTPDHTKLNSLLKTKLGIRGLNSIAKAENNFSGPSSGNPKGEDWEALAVCGIRAHQGKPYNSGPEWERVGKFWGDYSLPAIELGKNFASEFGIDDMEQWGAKGGLSTTDRWKPAKNKTPKTDLKSGKYKISLKKFGGSQLMSGGPEESISTLDAAMVTYCEDKRSKDKVHAVMTNIQNKMGSMSEKGTIGALEKRMADAEKTGKKLSPKDAQSAVELSLGNLNAAAITKDLENLFKDKAMQAHFCWEAATGQVKFGKNHPAAANELIVFKETGTLANRMTLDSPLGAGMKLATANNFYVSFKTGGGSSKPYLALRSAKAKVDKASLQTSSYIPTFNEILAEELHRENLLTEATEHLLQLDEFALWNTIKKKAKGAASKVLDVSKKIYGAVMKRLKQAFDAIKRLAGRMLNGLLNFFGIKVSNVKVKGGGSYPLL